MVAFLMVIAVALLVSTLFVTYTVPLGLSRQNTLHSRTKKDGIDSRSISNSSNQTSIL